MKKISVLVTTQNSSEAIFSCIDSIFKQTYDCYEIIIADGGSYKHNQRISDWIKNNPIQKSILHYKQRYAGKEVLRKKALPYATGEYVIFVEANDSLNQYALAELIHCIDMHNADIAMASFRHPYYIGCLKNEIYDLHNSADLRAYDANLIFHSNLAGKLYRKGILDQILLKNTFLQEELINTELLHYANKIVTTEKILLTTRVHQALFEETRFWDDKTSFWIKCIPLMEYRKKFFTKKKRQFPKINFLDLSNRRTIDYLLWELICYTARKVPIEQLSLELFHVFKHESFKIAIHIVDGQGLKWKPKTEQDLIASCLAFCSVIIKYYPSFQEIDAQLSIYTLLYMIFVKIFFRQEGTLNLNFYLCELRDILNLNEMKEAILVNSLDLTW